MLVPIIMGSKVDMDFAKKIGAKLESLGIQFVYRIASAHKAPQLVLKILEEYDTQDVVYITIAGRSNALSGFVCANSVKPVIACPPLDKQSYMMDIHSSLRMPSNAPAMVIVDPKNAALAAAKIFALNNADMRTKIANGIKQTKQDIEVWDDEVKA
jgi:5-(carboxyamino)imidazole ribonucleotide mutase